YSTTILCNIQEAVPERNEHCEDFIELTQSLSSKYPQLVSSWEQVVQEWEFDLTKPNPFEVKADEITQASIHLCLAKEDTKAASSSSLPPLHPEITSSVLMDNGIELEEEQ
ncbi:hypothetical protein EV363DRAFT_1139450, partial [Boletus edulis]